MYKWHYRNNTKNDMISTVTGLGPTLCLRFSDGCLFVIVNENKHYFIM